MVSGKGYNRSQKINQFYGRHKDAVLVRSDIEKIARCNLESEIEVNGKLKRPGALLIVAAKLLLQEIPHDTDRQERERP